VLEPELPQYRFERSCHHWEFALEPFVFNLISSDTNRAVGHPTPHASYSLFQQRKAGQNGQRSAALGLMGLEVERKFLVNNDTWRARAEPGRIIRQGYLCIAPDRSVRIRLMGDAASLTVKGKAGGRSRQEFECTIPRHDAEQMLEGLCLRPLIEKTRFVVRDGGLKWEIDEFRG